MSRSSFASGRSRAIFFNVQVDANPQAVPALLAGLEPVREEVLPRLREVRVQPGRHELHRRRAALALLRSDPEQVLFLQEQMLLPGLEPEEMLLIRDQLAPYGERLREELWAEVRSEKGESARRFRALAALARYDPKNPDWTKAAATVVESLLAADTIHLVVRIRALEPVKTAFVEPLSKVFRDRNRPVERRVAVGILRQYAAEQPKRLADLLMDADERSFGILLPVLQATGEQGVAALHAELERRPGLAWTDAASAADALAQGQANTALALLHLGRPERAWPLWQHGPWADPSVRSSYGFRLARTLR